MPAARKSRSVSKASSRNSSPSPRKSSPKRSSPKKDPPKDPKKELASVKREHTKLQKEFDKVVSDHDKLQKKFEKAQVEVKELKAKLKEKDADLEFLYDVMEDPKKYREEYKTANDGKDILDILHPGWNEPVRSQSKTRDSRAVRVRNSSPRPSTARSTRFNGSSRLHTSSRALLRQQGDVK